MTEAFTGVRIVRVRGWELWPVRKSLDGKTWLCRWCAKPLSGNRTSYCSAECENEINIRASVPGARRFAIERAGGKCESCHVDLEALEAAFKWYYHWWYRFPVKTRGFGYPPKRTGNDWPVSPYEFRMAAGFRSAGHIWEVNHKVAIAEGGDPTDPSNWEVLCLRCHREHTRGVAKRLAEKRKVTKN